MEHLRRGGRRRRGEAGGQRQVRQRDPGLEPEEGVPLPGVRGQGDPLPQHQDPGAPARA